MTEISTGPATPSSENGSPLVEELSPVPEVMQAVRAFSEEKNLLLLESARHRRHVGRYSFLTADPYRFFQLQKASFGHDPFAELREAMQYWTTETVPDLPPFQGGAAGLLSYELGHAWERLPTAPYDEFQIPALAVGLYDWVLAWDHFTDKAWIVSQGFPEKQKSRRTDRAAKRLKWVRETLKRANKNRNRPKKKQLFSKEQTASSRPLEKMAPQYSAPGVEGLFSNFCRDDYLQAVQKVIDYIYAGDIFQANLSQRLLYPARNSSSELYASLRQCNPAPFAGLFAHHDWSVISASPERFVCVKDGEIETRPIKGTRERQTAPEADLFTRDELRESEKDQAENVMIVDLLRNDLSKVCAPGSIRVPHLCTVETYETVQHLVSEIRGRFDPHHDVWDLLQAVFPGGSITGAPKVRAMEVISELESTARGPYCGSLFYAGFDGSMDSNILIRTFTLRHGWIQCPVGGGIVAQSTPSTEYEETLHKAEGMLRALRASH